MPKTSDVGVIVGRFQVHRLHDAHEQLIRSVYDTHPQTLVVLGLSQARLSSRNPLDFEARKQMVLAAFPKATVLYLKDEPSDVGWSRHLDALIEDVSSTSQTVQLYGGRDSFIGRYRGKYPHKILEPETYASGTELRKSIAKSVKASEDFRAGVIWAASNGYARVFPTVDVAIRRKIEHERFDYEWLLVRKPTETLWRFSGGFVQPNDASLEVAARREVSEETGVSLGDLSYAGSMIVDDWRYRDETDKIMTTLFVADYQFGPVRPADDVAEAKWFKLVTGILVPEHIPLWEKVRLV